MGTLFKSLLVCGDKLSNLSRLLASGKFVVTSQIDPPLGTDLSEITYRAHLLQGWVDALTIKDTDQGRIGSASPVSLMSVVFPRGIDVILQMNCRDRNRVGLQSDLLGASILGAKNILCVTGDPFTDSGYENIKQVYDVGSDELIKIASDLNLGKDINGNMVKGTPAFYIGGVINPFASELADEIIRVKYKVEAGAEFFHTQPFFEVNRLEEFLAALGSIDTKVIIGVLILESVEMARSISRMPGIEIPEEIFMELDKAKDKTAKGIEIAARIVKAAKEIYAGVHIIDTGSNDLIPLVLEYAGIFRREI
jgi:5,10-methylenetetrahydrofolate reductase